MMTASRVITATLLLAALVVGLSPVWGQGDPAQKAKGEQIYAEKKCALWHMINGKGGKAGGDLSQAGAKRDAQWFTRFLKDPKALVPKAKMLPFKGSDEELEALAAYLASLKGGRPWTEN